MHTTFWDRTLKIFRSEPVRITLRGRGEVIGDIEAIGDARCTIRTADGAVVLVEFDQILAIEPAVGRL